MAAFQDWIFGVSIGVLDSMGEAFAMAVGRRFLRRVSLNAGAPGLTLDTEEGQILCCSGPPT
jgi:hypothetical protein